MYLLFSSGKLLAHLDNIDVLHRYAKKWDEAFDNLELRIYDERLGSPIKGYTAISEYLKDDDAR